MLRLCALTQQPVEQLTPVLQRLQPGDGDGIRLGPAAFMEGTSSQVCLDMVCSIAAVYAADPEQRELPPEVCVAVNTIMEQFALQLQLGRGQHQQFLGAISAHSTLRLRPEALLRHYQAEPACVSFDDVTMAAAAEAAGRLAQLGNPPTCIDAQQGLHLLVTALIARVADELPRLKLLWPGPDWETPYPWQPDRATWLQQQEPVLQQHAFQAVSEVCTAAANLHLTSSQDVLASLRRLLQWVVLQRPAKMSVEQLQGVWLLTKTMEWEECDEDLLGPALQQDCISARQQAVVDSKPSGLACHVWWELLAQLPPGSYKEGTHPELGWQHGDVAADIRLQTPGGSDIVVQVDDVRIHHLNGGGGLDGTTSWRNSHLQSEGCSLVSVLSNQLPELDDSTALRGLLNRLFGGRLRFGM